MGAVPILVILVVGFVISVLVYELGHAIVGTFYGLRVEAFMFGPLQFDCTSRRLRRFPRPGFMSYIAAVVVEPSTKPIAQAIVEQRRMLLAGPLTDVTLAAFLIGYVLAFYPDPIGAQWQLLVIAGLNVSMAVENLIPGKGRYSSTDSARYLRLRKGGSLAENEIKMQRVAWPTTKPVRPSAWPSDFVTNAIDLLKEPNEHVGPITKQLIALLLYEHLADKGHLAATASWIEWTETILDPSKEPKHKRFRDALIAVRARHYALWNDDPARAEAVLAALHPMSWIRKYAEWFMPMALIQLSQGDHSSARKSAEKARQRLTALVNRIGSAQMELEWLDIIEQRINDASTPTPAIAPTPAD